MISEKQFAVLYTSFWAAVLPLGETAVRRMNLRVARVFNPLQADAPAAYNGFVNELAFRLVELSYRGGAGSVGEESVPEVYASTEGYIMRLPRASVPASRREREAAIRDAVVIGERLAGMIGDARGERSITFRPQFSGCGRLDACQGDVLIGDELWEVKSGDRQFRQTDVRQILIYCALNHAAKTRPIDRFSLVNPRAGIVADGTVTDLVHDIAGCDPGTLFDEIIEYVTLRETSV